MLFIHFIALCRVFDICKIQLSLPLERCELLIIINVIVVNIVVDIIVIIDINRFINTASSLISICFDV